MRPGAVSQGCGAICEWLAVLGACTAACGGRTLCCLARAVAGGQQRTCSVNKSAPDTDMAAQPLWCPLPRCAAGRPAAAELVRGLRVVKSNVTAMLQTIDSSNAAMGPHPLPAPAPSQMHGLAGAPNCRQCGTIARTSHLAIRAGPQEPRRQMPTPQQGAQSRRQQAAAAVITGEFSRLLGAPSIAQIAGPRLLRFLALRSLAKHCR